MPSSKVLIVAICSHRKHPGGQPVCGSEQALGSMVPDIRSELFEKRKDALKALKGAKRSGIPVKDYELNAKIEGAIASGSYDVGLATLIFLVMTLASVRSDRSGTDGVSSVSVVTAVLLALACFAGLVFYVHHVAATIQAPSVVASVVRDLHAVLAERDDYLPEVPRCTDLAEVAEAVAAADGCGGPVTALRSGYVELLDHGRLLDAAERAEANVARFSRNRR